ncbi:hypothetical protein SARC_05583 [Sphaeroforma arctica JP610]|uniref:Large ribosomal subunit protein mL38 n=1 Tax=Sphaeroforma arctica JP610 TaxID=667725 RepID=A0A0L0FZZ0_9EUKA|nr:hypothetical protein SARC_05583 [Sphaeroforma arctica JP610]KNC82131.1 hypothetical protein SARC_05583 [Sphaeroforma arctica JP610]|eukprot:XP_014156033.1 hypothetical protein SARC_05583 [Sphaeroforma arctica JP610]
MLRLNHMRARGGLRIVRDASSRVCGTPSIHAIPHRFSSTNTDVADASAPETHPLYEEQDKLLQPRHLLQAAARKKDWFDLLARREADPSLERNARLGLERVHLPDVAGMTEEEVYANYDGFISGTPLRVVVKHAGLFDHMFDEVHLKRLRRLLRISYGPTGDAAKVTASAEASVAETLDTKVVQEPIEDDKKAQKKKKKKQQKEAKASEKDQKAAKVKPSIPAPIVFNTDNNVYYGNFLKPAHMQTAPKVAFEGKPDKLYTLVLSSPDANVYDDEKEALHWMVANIGESDITQGVEVCKYVPPTPPYGFGACRYVFALYEQAEPVPMATYTADMIPGLSSFSSREFMQSQKAALKGVAFFQCEYDESVSKTFAETVGLETEPAYEALE